MRLLLTVFLVFFWIGPVQADYLYEYELEADIPDLLSYYLTWSFTTEALLTETTRVDADSLLSQSSSDIGDVLWVEIISPSTTYPSVATTLDSPATTRLVVAYSEPFDEPGIYEVGDLDFNSILVITETPMAPVPEPATMLLFGTGLAGLAGYRKRKAMKK